MAYQFYYNTYVTKTLNNILSYVCMFYYFYSQMGIQLVVHGVNINRKEYWERRITIHDKRKKGIIDRDSPGPVTKKTNFWRFS